MCVRYPSTVVCVLAGDVELLKLVESYFCDESMGPCGHESVQQTLLKIAVVLFGRRVVRCIACDNDCRVNPFVGDGG